MEQLSSNSKITFAKEATLKAIENGLIPKCTTANKAAEAVVDFYQTILNTINNDSRSDNED